MGFKERRYANTLSKSQEGKEEEDLGLAMEERTKKRIQNWMISNFIKPEFKNSRKN